MTRTALLVSAGVLLLGPTAASAHAVGVDARLNGDRVTVEAYFDDDTPAVDAKVVVTAADGAVVGEGKTDAKGVWWFPAPPAGTYRVEVNAGGGHLAKKTLTIPAGAAPPRPPTGPAEPVGSGGTDEVVSDGPTRADATGPKRWLTAGLGLGLIGSLTWAARAVARRKAPRGGAEGTG